MKDFNLNLNVEGEVILTEKGANVLNKFYNDLYRLNPTNNPHKIYYENDMLKIMLWELFEIFGNCIHMGCDTPFKGNNIKIYQYD